MGRSQENAREDKGGLSLHGREVRVLVGHLCRMLLKLWYDSGTQETKSQPLATHFFCPRQGGAQGSRHLLVPAGDRGQKGQILERTENRLGGSSVARALQCFGNPKEG